MADRIVLMNAGRIEQQGRPDQLYQTPETIFAASFIGTPPMNIVPLEFLRPGQSGQMAGIRPEDLMIAPEGAQAHILSAEYLGADTLIEADLRGQSVLVRVPGQFTPTAGDRVHLQAADHHIHRFDQDTGRRIA